MWPNATLEVWLAVRRTGGRRKVGAGGEEGEIEEGGEEGRMGKDLRVTADTEGGAPFFGDDF